MTAIFFLSTGRCGTQWLTKHLQTHAPDSWRIEHEPLHFDYAPLANSPKAPLARNAQTIKNHLHSIKSHLATGGGYIECGFPCWRHLLWFRDAIGHSVKIVHLHRTPVETARSWLKLNAFVPPILPHLPVKTLFHPEAPEALFPEYSKIWDCLTAFEKCLYYWAELNQQALRFRPQWDSSEWFDLPFQDINDSKTLRKLHQFIGLGRPTMGLPSSPEDQFSGMEQAFANPALIQQHPEIQSVAQALGYPYDGSTNR